MKRFLLVRFSAMGDCVMASWAATSIRRRYPDSYLCWATQTRCVPVIDTQELASEIWEVPRERWKQNRWSLRTWREQVITYSGLRQRHIDIGIDLQGHSKTALCLRLSGAKRRVAARATDAFAERLNPVFGKKPADLHTVEWNLRVLQSLGDFELVRPIVPFNPEIIAKVQGQLAGAGPLVSLCVGASEARKRYPAWLTVAQKLVNEGCRVVVLGGPGDEPVRSRGVIDWVGQIPLSHSIATIQISDAHVAADTGTAHLAAACGTPVVSIFGPTNPQEYRPYTNRGIVLHEAIDPSSISPEQVRAATFRAIELRNETLSY